MIFNLRLCLSTNKLTRFGEIGGRRYKASKSKNDETLALIMGLSVPIFVKSRDDKKITFKTNLEVQINGGLDDEDKRPYLDV